MISIIICSRSKEKVSQLLENIKETIDSEYEILVIDNSKNSYSIFEAYNKGVNEAKGEILCFCHEDILFRTSAWGNMISNIFKADEQVGIIGFAGAHFLPDCPMYWSYSPIISEHNINTGDGLTQEFFHDDYYDASGLSEVVCVDGFCFFARKNLFEKISFDEFSYKGFHMYDMDICMQVINLGYKVCVTTNILIEHFWSYNKFMISRKDGKFDNDLITFTNKWHNSLPIHRGIENILADYSILRINQLCNEAYDCRKVRSSNSYKIGRFFLAPLRYIKYKTHDS